LTTWAMMFPLCSRVFDLAFRRFGGFFGGPFVPLSGDLSAQGLEPLEGIGFFSLFTSDRP
jgi:hypothetical protein